MSLPTESGVGGQTTTLSVIVPVYSGEKYLTALIQRIVELRNSWRSAAAPIDLAEVVLVDDNATDNSPTMIDDLAREHEFLVALHLARNYGQHGATVAGILHSSGDWVVTMDEDLQHPPERIYDLLRCGIEQQADVVYARPTGLVHGTMTRDWTSVAFKRLLKWATGNPHLTSVNSFRLMRGEVARSTASVAMHDTYFDVNLTWFTQRIVVLPMELRDERYIVTGGSGYRWRNLIRHGWRMLFSSQIRILQFATFFGAFTVAVAAVFALTIIVVKFVSPASIAIQGWSSLVVLISFFSGIILIMGGISLQYLSTLVLRAHGKPAFFVIDRSRDLDLMPYFGKEDG